MPTSNNHKELNVRDGILGDSVAGPFLMVIFKLELNTKHTKIQPHTFNSLWLLLVVINHQFSTFLNEKSVFHYYSYWLV
jgi:hypothetical protein